MSSGVRGRFLVGRGEVMPRDIFDGSWPIEGQRRTVCVLNRWWCTEEWTIEENGDGYWRVVSE